MTIEIDLSGRVALVTGGGSGIGYEIACELAARGSDLVLSGHLHGGQLGFFWIGGGWTVPRLFKLPGSVYVDPEFSWLYEIGPSGAAFVKGTALGPEYDGTLWLGTDGGFLVGRRGTLWLKAQVPLTMGGDLRIRALQMASNGRTVLLATAEGLFAFDGQDFSGQRAIHLPWLGTVRR